MLRMNRTKVEDEPGHFGDEEYEPWSKLPLGK